MSKRVQCKFFAHGACLKGEHCEFAHDRKAQPNNICTFYQKGACAYGSRCRYEHVKASRPSSDAQDNTSPGCSSFAGPFYSPTIPAWNAQSRTGNALDSYNHDLDYSSNLDPLDQPMCSFAAAGNCPRGEKCPHIHGDLCPSCGRLCLHPTRLHEREEHIKTCEKRQKHLEALTRSQGIECSVCLELVLSKPTPAERKFGILSECDHPFCVSCIRSWRGNSPASGLDINSALRACPICRKLSYFVIPSVIWYFSEEEKSGIVESYKAKLKSIDCKHFDFGSGSCPFGTSCFYKHAYRDGRLEEVVLRHLGAEDGNTVIAKDIRLSDFLRNLQIR
ncbi:zinc finger (CCCH-type/C3HC4-type RING finger)family protein [Striga asiatica]|uniref:Zinc finger (CCCH-type/C3HC4-type RING finger)family protein n=1 Tax=Striga asiatica TaxID=4170 RepID=A0A5A7PID6_STRAF|nr:zinc finger (CCCH-type/C3HC4-type RING finger)family protein [Striga asiatica]